ncbi:hypothetical protein KCU77_g5007, partial [Aureobasidium melanogenum]
MKHTYNIYQWCIYNCCKSEIFLDMDPEALERHSTYFHCLLSFYNTPWHYRSPAKRYKELHLHPLQYWMQPNALRYVLCAINKAKNGKRIFLDLPRQFVMAVEVYQVVVFLQVEDCIGPLHGHIRQVIRERPLEPIELEAVRFCLSNLAPKIYEFALSTQYERERQVWLLGPRIQDPEHKDQAMRIVDEEAESSGEETVIEMDSHQDTEMISHDIGTASDEIGYTAEDEASNQEYETTDQEYERPTTCIPIRRRSAPTPYSTRMYDIDTSEFRECADEDPEYRSTGGRREEHCLHTDKDKQTQTILNVEQATQQISNAESRIEYGNKAAKQI